MTTCLGMSYSFSLLCVFSVNVYQCKRVFFFVFFFHFGFEGRMWDLIVLVPDRCLYFNFAAFTGLKNMQERNYRKFRVVFTVDTESAVCPKCAAESLLPY